MCVLRTGRKATAGFTCLQQEAIWLATVLAAGLRPHWCLAAYLRTLHKPLGVQLLWQPLGSQQWWRWTAHLVIVDASAARVSTIPACGLPQAFFQTLFLISWLVIATGRSIVFDPAIAVDLPADLTVAAATVLM